MKSVWSGHWAGLTPAERFIYWLMTLPSRKLGGSCSFTLLVLLPVGDACVMRAPWPSTFVPVCRLLFKH